MKKSVLSLIFILTTIIIAAQSQEENAFQQSENQATGTSREGSAIGAVGSEQEQAGPGNPPGDDDIPIDDYLPLLALTGMALVVYKYRYKIKLN